MKMVTFELEGQAGMCVTVWPDHVFLAGEKHGATCRLCSIHQASDYWQLIISMEQAQKELEEAVYEDRIGHRRW